MNWTIFGITVFVVFGVIAFVFVWALLRSASRADDIYEARRRNPPDDDDPFGRPHGEL